MKLESTVIFGDGWKRDGLGLKGNGKIAIEGDSITVTTDQHTSPFFKILLWISAAMMTGNICLVLYSAFFSGYSYGVFLTIVFYAVGILLIIGLPTFITSYFGSSPFSARFPKKSLKGIDRNGSKITLRLISGKDFLSFQTATEDQAVQIEGMIREGI